VDVEAVSQRVNPIRKNLIEQTSYGGIVHECGFLDLRHIQVGHLGVKHGRNQELGLLFFHLGLVRLLVHLGLEHDGIVVVGAAKRLA